MKLKKGISVVIPNYNGAALLPHILPCLYEALNNTTLAYEVIVVDDCSTDNTVEYLQKNYPTIILLQTETNKGFSPTINKGIFAGQYNLLLMLNSDVKLTPHFFEKQLPYFDKPDTFGVMSRIVGWDNDAIQDGGKYPTMQGVKIKTSTNFIPKNENSTDSFYSMYLSGANAFVSTQKLLQIGGFNEMFAPFYIEDVELSLRAWRMGWKCYYEHNAICRHKTSTTIKTKESKNYVKAIYYRNKMFLHAIHLSGARLWFWYASLIAEIIIHVLTGRFYYFASLRNYFKYKDANYLFKSKFASLNKNMLSTSEVVKVIKDNLFERIEKK